jgi:hypothetical protein
MVSENKVISRIPKLSAKKRKNLRNNIDNRLKSNPEDTVASDVLAALNDFEESIPTPAKRKKTSSIKWEPQPTPRSYGRIDGKAVAYISKHEDHTNDRKYDFSVTVLGIDYPGRLDSVIDAKKIAWENYQERISQTEG